MSKRRKNRVSLSASFLPCCNRNVLNKVLSHVCRHFFSRETKEYVNNMGLEGTVINNTSGILLDHSTYVDLHKMYLHKFLRYIYLPQTVDENGQIISSYTIIRTYLVHIMNSRVPWYSHIHSKVYYIFKSIRIYWIF